MVDNEEMQKTSVYVNRKLYEKLKITKLIPGRTTLTATFDKFLRKELGVSPRFSYPDKFGEEEEEKGK
jgi:hypothetical protein